MEALSEPEAARPDLTGSGTYLPPVMFDRQRVTRWLLVGFVVASAVPTGAAAQSAQPSVLLDQDATKVATVHVDNRTYDVYRYDNALPYADGLEIVTDGRTVTDAEVADRVFQALARRSGTKFEPVPETISELERVVERSREIQNATDRALAALNRSARVRAQLANETVNGTDAWEVVTERSDALDEAYTGSFVSTPPADSLRTELRTARSAAAAVERDALAVIDLLQAREGTGETNQSALYRRYRQLYNEIGEMEGQLDRTRELMATTAKLSARGARQAADVQEVGAKVEREFSAVASTLNESLSRLEEAGSAVAALQDPLPPVVSDEAYQQRLTEEWNHRRGARFEVLATIGEAGIFVLAGVVALFET